ncbi:GNAT family N-acetyltransferase [Pseudomonas sp. NFACC13-1]|uniref:GNAT family N-acetyltransferase n=1 Tax=Pseudomonas sp. NFACC13-1 TaxID=1566245 RepID=UPI00088B67C6|nr:GNAT family N-acetyltransferase [Pseudomonas sp. NFACC13-1]SDB33063.1 Acetyltransferase (GNAT) family protein [Pseudomonas sp. NFACC13-1]
MPVTVRVAMADDAQHLFAIEASAVLAFRSIDELSWVAQSPPMSVERHRQLIALSTCWVALDDESRPQGFLSAERYGEALHIHEVSVALSWQGQGLGRRLIEVAQDYARSNGLGLITLTTFIDVPWNAPFYASMGFQAKATQDLEPRLATILNAEYQRGYAPGSRCAMVWSVT